MHAAWWIRIRRKERNSSVKSHKSRTEAQKIRINSGKTVLSTRKQVVSLHYSRVRIHQWQRLPLPIQSWTIYAHQQYLGCQVDILAFRAHLALFRVRILQLKIKNRWPRLGASKVMSQLVVGLLETIRSKRQQERHKRMITLSKVKAC